MIKQLFEEIRSIKKALANVVTKEEAKHLATKDDLKNFATKDDLKKLKDDLIEEIKESEGFIVSSVDKNKADKGVVDVLDKRVTRIERKLTA